MDQSKCPELLSERLNSIPQFKSAELRLVILLGLLGDFDSFEYARELYKNLEKLEHAQIRFHIIGIGTDKSKKRFCQFSGLPFNLVSVDRDSTLHDSLGLYRGLNLPISPYINLLLMCAGFGSPGTLKEVLRGYIGDANSVQNIENTEVVKIADILSVKGEFFSRFAGNGYLRPFEMATIRLKNLVEVLSNWNVYMEPYRFLNQRGGTYLIDSNNNILYFYHSKGVLGYSRNMADPLDFLDNWIAR